WWRPWPRAPHRGRRRSLPPDGGSNQRPAPASDQGDPPPSGIRSRRSDPRRSRFPSTHGETRSRGALRQQATCCAETRSPASPSAALAPRAAMPPPRPRAAWLRIFVARCSLPCDPPVGGHSCHGGMIARFHRVVCDLYGAIGVKAGVNSHLLVRSDGDHLLVPT